MVLWASSSFKSRWQRFPHRATRANEILNPGRPLLKLARIHRDNATCFPIVTTRQRKQVVLWILPSGGHPELKSWSGRRDPSAPSTKQAVEFSYRFG